MRRSGYSKVEGDTLPPPAKLPPPGGGSMKKNMTQSERIAKFIADTGEKNLPVEAGTFLKTCEPIIAAGIKCFIVVAPIYKKAYMKAYEIYEKAPKNVIQMVFGICLCFFGGTYVGARAPARREGRGLRFVRGAHSPQRATCRARSPMH